MVKVARTKEQNHQELMALTVGTFDRFKAEFDAKDSEGIAYLYGELDSQTSDKVLETIDEANQQIEDEINKGDTLFEPDLKQMLADKGLDIEFMENSLNDIPNIPDFVVRKKGQTGPDYLALIKLAQGIIEVKDASIEQEMMQFAQEWENVRQAFANDPGFNHDHFDFTWSDDVTVYNLF